MAETVDAPSSAPSGDSQLVGAQVLSPLALLEPSETLAEDPDLRTVASALVEQERAQATIEEGQMKPQKPLSDYEKVLKHAAEHGFNSKTNLGRTFSRAKDGGQSKEWKKKTGHEDMAAFRLEWAHKIEGSSADARGGAVVDEHRCHQREL